MISQKFPGRFESLAKISECVAKAAQQAGFDEDEVYEIQLAVDEACSNIIEHAYGGEDQGDIECTCDGDKTGLKIIIQDWGDTFDPTSIPEPDYQKPLDEIKFGGAGLILIKKIMDEVDYNCSPKKGNTLTMVKLKTS